ncbi:hypothetical protein TWF718_006969 [Orbilia javanica]|uniref:Uncharacterized protein n=1 Tax=Orbilia javanica TaxID=47235 RepID=A0AAN8N234_9PEZI
MSSGTAQAIEAPSVDTASPNNSVAATPEPQRSTDALPLIVEDASEAGPPAHEARSMDVQPNNLQEHGDTTPINGHPDPNFILPTPLTNRPPSTSESDIAIPPLLPITAVSETSDHSSKAIAESFSGVGDNDFDDDFDDFGETVEDGDGFEDFGDFDSAAPVAEAERNPIEIVREPPRSPLLDFTKMSTDEMKTQIDGIISSLYPQDNHNADAVPAPIPPMNSAFLTERSQSLWTQLCTPPPLQPPNWKLSRIRRLFLVSLGVPVDLDEILPADTKQKKLVLPSSSHTRKSSDAGRGDGDRSNRSSSRRRKEKEAQSRLVDMPSARILCSTSDVRLRAFTVGELEEHVKKLEEVTREASETLTYWLGKRETALGDKEAFERVIENLVEFAKKKR